MESTKNKFEKLNELIEINEKAVTGYNKAAAIVENLQLKSLFKEQAQTRTEFKHQLKSEITKTTILPEKETENKINLNRPWMSINDTIASRDEALILKEILSSEKTTVTAYKEILSHVYLATATRSIVIRQISEIENALRSIKNMEIVFA